MALREDPSLVREIESDDMARDLVVKDSQYELERLRGVGGFDARPSSTLVEVFSGSVRRWPKRVALDDGQQRLTFAQLDAAARRLARRLSRSGIGRGDRVGVRVPGGTSDLYVAVLGVLKAGAAYVPVDYARSGDASRADLARGRCVCVS